MAWLDLILSPFSEEGFSRHAASSGQSKEQGCSSLDAQLVEAHQYLASQPTIEAAGTPDADANGHTSDKAPPVDEKMEAPLRLQSHRWDKSGFLHLHIVAENGQSVWIRESQLQRENPDALLGLWKREKRPRNPQRRYEIFKIHGYKRTSRGAMLLVQWAGFPADKESTWELQTTWQRDKAMRAGKDLGTGSWTWDSLGTTTGADADKLRRTGGTESGARNSRYLACRDKQNGGSNHSNN
ncbi:hypothetical protein K4F52_009486 [Lecanicillium sp. MT-2017a]|nr:hypothetical protein K4F52_009486 [Lecanicillium sp. MT-2017a]